MSLSQTWLVGVEDNGDGGLRLYLDNRSRGLYALVYDEDWKAKVQEMWANTRQHILIPAPPAECIYSEAADAA